MERTHRKDEIYCPEYRKAIKRRAILCPFCRIRIRKISKIIKEIIELQRRIQRKISK